MTPEEILFEKLSKEMETKFEQIKDSDVKDAVKASFDTYKEMYQEKTDADFTALKNDIEKVNKQLGALDGDQTKEVATQLSKVEERLVSFEASLKDIGKKVSQSQMGSRGGSGKDDTTKQIETYLSNKLPNENGTVLFDALDGMGFDAVGRIEDVDEKNTKVASLSSKSMFAAIDHTNDNSVAGQGIARDLNTMGFKDIPPILNDHVADIFTTPKMEKKTYMTLRIFHTYVDGSGIKTEGTGTFGKSSVQLKSQDFKVFTYGAQYRISVEEYEDVPEIAAQLKMVIPDLLMNDIDTKILTDGGDNSTAPWGAFSTNVTYPNCTTFNPYLYAGSNSDADVADVVSKMKLYAKSQNYRTNGVLAHDNFYDNYEGLRDANGNSLMDRRVQFSPSGEITAMASLAARKTRIMNETAVFVTATPSQILGIRDNVMMQVGMATGDFETHNISTKYWGRFAYGAKDASANIYCADFNAAIEVLQMSNTTAIAYCNGVAAGTSGYEETNITISLLSAAGATDLSDDNESAYQTAIAAEDTIADLAALQTVIDTVNAA